MELKYYITILSHIGAVISTMDRKGASETGNILDSLLSNYDKRFRPGYNRNTTEVRVSMDVEYLEVDENQKTCSLYFLFRLKWTDERLRLGPDATHISVHDQNLIDKFWKPSKEYNVDADKKSDFFGKNPNQPLIFSLLRFK